MEALHTSGLSLNYQHINSERVFKNIVMEYQQISNLLTINMQSIYNLLVKKAKLFLSCIWKFKNYHMENMNFIFLLVYTQYTLVSRE